MTILGYLWGKKKDKQNVTLEIQRPEAIWRSLICLLSLPLPLFPRSLP